MMIRFRISHRLMLPTRFNELEPLISFLQFNDSDFASLSGARVVRIATHPDFQGVCFPLLGFSSFLAFAFTGITINVTNKHLIET